MEFFPALEHLKLTPRGCVGNDTGDLCVSVMPPATAVAMEVWDEYRLATPAEARANKKRGIRIMEAAYAKEARVAKGHFETDKGDEVNFPYDEDKDDLIVLTASKEEYTRLAPLTRLEELMARAEKWEGNLVKMRYKANLSKEQERKMDKEIQKKADGPTRPVQSRGRKVYGPITKGREEPVVATGTLRLRSKPMPWSATGSDVVYIG